jgi:hypothetical protein
MPGKKLPESTLRPGAPDYGNARGRAAAKDNEGIEEEANPGVSPGSVPEDAGSKGVNEAQQFRDKNYAQYMNRGDGRYVKFMEDQSDGTFGADKDHGGKTRRIHRQKSP